ncbi:MAG: peptidoglycan bridge formation glycyltransferase FemA/FemB family protein [Chloroflexi bacterium]|nr:peptidoglycan bridge formation glycyltransferase FemA/FemB family protein [Chloroflexota bacterium]
MRTNPSQTRLLDFAWDHFVATHPRGHLLQTSGWARLKAAFGWRAARATLWDDRRAGHARPADAALLAGASLLFRRLPWGQTFAYAPKGPLVNWEDAGQVRGLLAEATAVCRRHWAAVLVIEPELLAADEQQARLASYGLRPSPRRIQPLSTIHVDLTADEATLLARMKQKWRYNIRLAERKGVTVREGTPADLPAIQQLMEVTGRRDQFGVHNLAYHTEATAIFQPAGLMTWLIAEHAETMLAAIAVFALGPTAWYMWGASSDDGRHLMPNHALQWAAMRWARLRGCTTYDLWGIPDEAATDAAAESDGLDHADRTAGLWGVYRFKQGFGGRATRYTGAWELLISRPGYWLYRLGLRVRQGGGQSASEDARLAV